MNNFLLVLEAVILLSPFEIKALQWLESKTRNNQAQRVLNWAEQAVNMLENSSLNSQEKKYQAEQYLTNRLAKNKQISKHVDPEQIGAYVEMAVAKLNAMKKG